MSRPIAILRIYWSALLTLAAGASAAMAQEPVLLPARELQEFFSTYCFDCHGEKKQKAELDLLEHLKKGTPQPADREIWAEAVELMIDGEMPPEKKDQPSPELRAAVIADLTARVEAFDAAVPDNPGRVTVRRLNRDEYNRTIRDLLAVDFAPADDFPPDEISFGFDHIGDALTVSPVLMEKYLDAAESIAKRVIVTREPVWPPVARKPGNQLARRSYEGGDSHLRVVGASLGIYREGEGQMTFKALQDGEYLIRIRAHQDRAGPEDARMAVKVDDQELLRVDVPNRADRPMTFTHKVRLGKGAHLIAAGFMNNFNSDGDRNLFVHWIDVEGPLGMPAPPMPVSHRKLIPSPPPAGEERKLARQMLRDFAGRAWRRPASIEEAERLAQLVDLVMDDGENFATGMQVALQAVLSSPNFLFRWELDSTPVDGDGVRELGGYELASRLSYFLWGSLPDEALLARAADGSLADPEILKKEAMRLLRDPRSDAFIENFSGQWLQTRNLDTLEPDPDVFPEFDDELRASMRRESDLFFRSIVREDRSVLELIDADFTFLDERLARHYGIDGVDGKEFRRIALQPGDHRGGILGQAAILTLTSNATRTSPVNRGKWVLEQLLGTPPPPPPPDVPELEESKEASTTASLRERLEMHQASPDCSGCHAKMDPIGFALENFDAIGRWRDLDGKFVIDPAGTLPGGVAISGSEDLKKELAKRDDFLKTLSERMLTYALGRGTEFYDRRVVEGIAAKLGQGEKRFSILLEEIVVSDPFRLRKVEEQTE